jgi:hypothetical protein
MRTMVKITVPVEAGNKAFRDGTLQETIMGMIDELKPEAAYFFPERGIRTAMFFIDLNDSSDIPVIAEPLFERLNASVEFLTVMNADDLKKGFGKFQ